MKNVFSILFVVTLAVPLFAGESAWLDGWRAYWRAKRPALDAAIDQLRKRDYDFAVTDEQGRALTNVDVEVRQVSSDFIWGCAALSLGQLGVKNADY